MSDPIVTREEISTLASEAALEFARTGRVPMNRYPALSEAARLFDLDFKRYAYGGEPEESEASA
jgi:hypothetical protein